MSRWFTAILVRTPPWFLVALGCGVGAAARVLVLDAFDQWGDQLGGPASRRWLVTALINLLGSVLAGMIYAWAHGIRNLDRRHLAWAALAITGFCGGFTTFSGFGSDTSMLAGTGHLDAAIGNLWIAMVIAILGGRLGILLTRRA